MKYTKILRYCPMKINKGRKWYQTKCLTVPDMGARRCLGPEGNGVSLGKGDKGGPGPRRNEGDKQSVLNEVRENMDKDEEEWASWA
jgi:hypothetical protein